MSLVSLQVGYRDPGSAGRERTSVASGSAGAAGVVDAAVEDASPLPV